MDNIENYWAIVSHSTVVLNYSLEGWLFYRFVKPFMKNKPYYVGIGYSIIMLLFSVFLNTLHIQIYKGYWLHGL